MRCVIYSRVSTANQSYDNQINQLKEYAVKHEWDVVNAQPDIVERFIVSNAEEPLIF